MRHRSLVGVFITIRLFSSNEEGVTEMETDSQGNHFGKSEWGTLYRVAGAVALVMAGFIPIQILVYVIWPPPQTVAGWYELFRENKLVGLLDMDLLLMADQLFVSLIIVALYAALWQTGRSLMTIAITLGLLGVAIYFASTVAFEMLALSGKYVTAATESERNIVLAAGETMMATWQGTAFDFGYVCEAVAFILIAITMLRGTVFGKVTAWVGIALGVLSLVPPTVPVVGMLFAFGSLVPLVVWDILIARRFFRLSNT